MQVDVVVTVRFSVEVKSQEEARQLYAKHDDEGWAQIAAESVKDGGEVTMVEVGDAY